MERTTWRKQAILNGRVASLDLSSFSSSQWLSVSRDCFSVEPLPGRTKSPFVHHHQSTNLKRPPALRLTNSFPSEPVSADNWLAHEPQPTDSEMESVKMTTTTTNHLPTESSPQFKQADPSISSDDGSVRPSTRRLLNPMDLMDSFRAMSKDQLREMLKALRALYRQNFGSDEDDEAKRFEAVDKDIMEIKAKLETVVEQQKQLRIRAAVERRNSSFCSNEISTTSVQEEDFEDDDDEIDGKLDELSFPHVASPIPFGFAQRRKEFLDPKMEKRRTERERFLLVRQTQRKENMLQRRIQRETARRLLEEKERQEMDRSLRRKADERLKRDLIMNFHRAEKDEEKSSSRYDLSKPSSVRPKRIGGISDLANRTAQSPPWQNRLSNSSYMSPTASYRFKVNRAASVNSLLAFNSPEDGEVYGSQLQSNSAGSRSFLSLRHPAIRDSSLMARSTNELNHVGERQNSFLDRTVSSSTISDKGRKRSSSRIPLKSNRAHIINALTQVALAGAPNKRQRDIVLKEIEESPTRHLMILFRDHRLQYRALYSFSGDSNFIEKLHGIGPNVVDETNVEKFYKYNSCTKSFALIPAKHFSIQTDGLILKDDLWTGSRRR